MPSPPINKGLVLDTRTGALYGAALGFAIGLVWQAVVRYDDPLALWRWLIVGGATVGGAFGFGYARTTERDDPGSPNPVDPD